MRSGRTLAFVVLALLVGGIISQLPSALADDSENPFSAMWDAIFDLQSRDDDLQAQIDELRAERSALLAQTGAEPVFVSDLYAELEVETTEDGRTLVYVTAGNDGPDRAAGVKLTTFYLMPLFEINSISGDQCEDKSRGIIECVLGTLEEDQESVITIDATARESGKVNTWTVDISTTTDDSDYTNNHATYNFETGSGEPIEIPEVVQPEEEQIIEDEISEETEAELEPEQDDSTSNSTSTETEEPQESSGNQTSTENESEETSGGNQTSTETEETVGDSGSNSTNSEGSEGTSGESSTEESTDGAAEQESQDESSSETGEEQTGSDDEPVEEQGASEESGTDESAQDGSGESSGNEESGSEDPESSDSSEQESSDGDSEESRNSEDSGEGGSESGAGEESPSQ